MRTFLIENYQKTTLPLSVRLTCPQKGDDPPHMHDCYEFVLISEGCGWCSVNGKRYPILRGDLYVMNSSDVHEFSIKRSLKLYNIMFRDTLLSPEEKTAFQSILEKHGKYTFPPAVSERLFLLLDETAEELKKNFPDTPIIAKALFLRFLATVCRNIKMASEITSAEKEGDVSRMFELITRRFRENLTLADLAAATGGTAEYTGRRFKRLTGMAFSNYLRNYRISHARNLLESTNRSISEIALELGWFDLAHFDKQFRQSLGMTPSAYRKLSRQSE